uniref:Uncharacterized protein n=1 Tax=Calcidiscus leptoporus TaxID=127549 RepID=A0A7S0IY40_9EUKA|mmetsp:Transcript_28549/g.66901  ORF Transcript_28549/g.66901 Transcript_28549/m.66901 type:complete len:433 (+) Transcript_28549:184-1482(+)
MSASSCWTSLLESRATQLLPRPPSSAPHDALPWQPSYERLSLLLNDSVPSSPRSCHENCIISVDLPGATAGIGSTLAQLAGVLSSVWLSGGTFQLKNAASFVWADKHACAAAGAGEGFECMFAPLGDAPPGCGAALHATSSQFVVDTLSEPFMRCVMDVGTLRPKQAQHCADTSCPQPGDGAPSDSALRRICPRVQHLQRRGSYRLSMQHVARPSAFFRAWLGAQYAAFWTGEGRLVLKRGLERASLLAVHIRWGDKIIEAELVPAEAYLRAVLALVRKHAISRPVVFVSSEDAAAIQAFESAVAHSSEAAAHHLELISHRYVRPSYGCGQAGKTRAELLAGMENPSWTQRAARFNWGHLRSRNSSKGCLSIGESMRHVRKHNSQPLGFLAMLNLYLSLEAAHVVCGPASSNWCTLLRTLADTDSVVILGSR